MRSQLAAGELASGEIMEPLRPTPTSLLATNAVLTINPRPGDSSPLGDFSGATTWPSLSRKFCASFLLVHPDFVQRTRVVSIPGVLDQRGAPTCQRSFDPVRSERVHPEAWM